MVDNVYLFIPNIIGYGRIILLLVSFYFMPYNPEIAMATYMLSQLLDAFDGYTARLFKQTTMFGAVLDMVTDRVSTMCLSIVLAMFYVRYTFLIQFVVMLDISSHWLQMYCSLVCGEKSHKDTDNVFLKLYYNNRTVLFLMCAGNELFHLMAYMMYFSNGPLGLWQILFFVTAPVCALKQLISVVQLIAAVQRLVEIDTDNRLKSSQQQ
ncbi:PREDICTED: CDP-diacylglycerol--inositol 3-phosphatidyltransferase-like isoform X2 [Amphimedon queenslandica]|uniref:CDP-diacylglycerol--inositol 3-phosphatidyltransferase n=1 Tax=Amphimedon queenslandica TaxID=400682 RepID=A0A1X7VIB8_AMPQE|nr:PREDICTED: CDP-diacylglycerol--inositol 3-phosphatidyltransferase-like isoform X2 [Amphimedon queenslandica]|eukprot:XP_003384133.1 PREDICTED: CDP-diacylglycerol--inositol 3-phosphatidyltransferase-like isoform X2 [Amphimedon queenslandica]